MRNKFNLQAIQNQWPDFDYYCEDEEKFADYLNKKKAVDLYISGVSLSVINETTGICKQEVLRLVNKCIRIDNKGQYVGYAGLVKYFHTKQTITKLEKLINTYPELKKIIIGCFNGDKDQTLENNMSIKHIHGRFIDACEKLGLKPTSYPFTTKDRGYKALRNFVLKYKLENPNDGIKREGPDANQKFGSTGFGDNYKLKPYFPYNIVQLDGHRIDLIYSIEYEDPSGNIVRKPATRAWLLLIIDLAVRTIIGYAISPYENYNQQDVLATVKSSIVPHRRLNGQMGLLGSEVKGFPSECVKQTEWAVFDTIMLDNAKAHLAKDVQQKLTEGLGIAVSYGSIKTPETRGVVERVFNTLEKGGFHRLPGTTGSNPKDTKRKNPDKEAVKYAISFEDIEELTEYFIAEYNNSAHDALFGKTPLQALKERIEMQNALPNRVEQSKRDWVYELDSYYDERVMRGGYKNGERPLVNHDRCKYVAKDSISMSFINQKVRLKINPEDLSSVKAYTMDGRFISDMIATGIYARFRHSSRTRTFINKAINENQGVNKKFDPPLEVVENVFRERENQGRRELTKVGIAKRDRKRKENHTDEQAIEKEEKRIIAENESENYDELIDQINSMSIEEAFKKGLF